MFTVPRVTYIITISNQGERIASDQNNSDLWGMGTAARHTHSLYTLTVHTHCTHSLYTLSTNRSSRHTHINEAWMNVQTDV